MRGLQQNQERGEVHTRRRKILVNQGSNCEYDAIGQWHNTHIQLKSSRGALKDYCETGKWKELEEKREKQRYYKGERMLCEMKSCQRERCGQGSDCIGYGTDFIFFLMTDIRGF